MKYYAFMLAVICISVFLLQLSFPITDEFVLISKDVLSRPWILVTSIFLHDPYEYNPNSMQYQVSFQHLVYNMIALVLFGLILESIIGSKKFLIIFFITGIIASIGSAFFYEASLGASGAIMGIIGALAILRPKMMIYVPFGFIPPMPMIVAAGLWALIDLAGMFYPSQTANAAHLFGLGAGVVIGLVLREKFSARTKKREKILTERDVDKWEDEYMRCV